MTLHVIDTPAKMTTRRQTVEFKAKVLALILADYCRAQGVVISEDCKLSVWGLDPESFCSVTLCVEGN